MIKIEKGIPIPAINRGPGPRGRKLERPFNQLEIGDSFLVECPKEDAARIQRNVTASHINWAKRRGLPNKLTTRREEKGVRFWRIK